MLENASEIASHSTNLNVQKTQSYWPSKIAMKLDMCIMYITAVTLFFLQ